MLSASFGFTTHATTEGRGGAMPMTPEEVRQLEVLLRKVKREEGGWIPEECLKAFYGIGCTPFYEFVYYREAWWGGGTKVPEYLLAYRDDQWWPGYHHVMGSMIKPGHPADPWSICEELTKKEFREHSGQNGVRINSLRIVSTLHWKAHPWCHPLAVVFLVEIEGEIPETDTFRFYPVHRLPKPMVPNHENYLLQCKEMLTTGKPLVFTKASPLGITALR